MGRNIEQTCNICQKKIGWGHLKRHIKKHGDMGNTGKISSQLVLSKDEVGRICLKNNRGNMGNRREIKNDEEIIQKTLFKQ